jgi:16S rRNA (adenine1518-N6/adenine1519-N6)-dimethyltransferase
MRPTKILPPLDIPRLLAQIGRRPDKQLGQNFLINDHYAENIIESAGLTGDELVLEIGPGLGSLTRYLASVSHNVIAVELDADLIPPLQSVLASFDNITIIQGDILRLDIDKLLLSKDQSKISPVKSYVVVANIPYYITSALIRHLLECKTKPERIVLTIQTEVAMRIIAVPNDMNLLGISVQVYGKPSITTRIPAGAFYPVPKIESAVVRIDLYPTPLVPLPLMPLFFRLAKAGFSQKRKTLRNAISAGMNWSPASAEGLLHLAEIDPQRRAETLSINEWIRLVIQTDSQPLSSPQ